MKAPKIKGYNKGGGVSAQTKREKLDKKYSPKEWDSYAKDKGYIATGYKDNLGYAEYYDPTQYSVNKSVGFDDSKGSTYTKIGDVGRQVDYSNDSTYKPFIMPYWDASGEKAKPVVDPNRKPLNFNNPSFVYNPNTNTYSEQGTGYGVPINKNIEKLKKGGLVQKLARGGGVKGDTNGDGYIDALEQKALDDKKKQNINNAAGIAGTIGSAYYSSQAPENEGDVVYNQGMQIVGQLGPWGKIIQGGAAIGEAIYKPIRKDAEQIDPKTGRYKDVNKATVMGRVGATFNPGKAQATVLLDKEASNETKAKFMASNLLTAGWGTGLFMGSYYKDKDKAMASRANKNLAMLNSANRSDKMNQLVAARNAQEENPTINRMYNPNDLTYDKNQNITLANGEQFDPNRYAKGGLVNKVKQMCSEGGEIEGKGGPKDDKIEAKVKEGSFVVPAENAELAKGIRKLYLKAPIKKANLKQEEGEEVKLSNGEHLFTPEENEYLESIGINLEDLAPNAEHGEEEMAKGGLTAKKARMILHDKHINGKPLTDKQRRFFGAISSGASIKMACGGEVKGYAKGGPVKGTKIDGATWNGKNWVSDNGSVYSAEGGKKFTDKYNQSVAKEKANEEQRKASLINVYSRKLKEATVDPKKERERIAKEEADIKNAELNKKVAENKLDAQKNIKKHRDFTQQVLIGSANKIKELEAEYDKTKKGQNPEYLGADVIRTRLKQLLDDIEGQKEHAKKYAKEYELSKNESNYDANGDFKPSAESKKYLQKETTTSDTRPKYERKKQSDKTYEELIKKPNHFVGTDAEWKKAVDESIAKGDTIPKGGSSTAFVTKPSLKAPVVKKKESVVVETMPSINNTAKLLNQDNELRANNDIVNAEKSINNTVAKQEAINANLKKNNTDYIAKNKPKGKGLADYIGNIDPTAFVGIGQAALGVNMLKDEKRPVDKAVIDPTYNAAVNRSIQDAKYGLTPEQKFMATQDIQNALNDAKAVGLNTSGGSGVQAFNTNRAAINDAWRNKLGLKQADLEARMNKQKYADAMAADRANILSANRRQAFNDAMDTFQQKQQAGSELVGAGLQNIIGAYRFNKEMQNNRNINDASNPYKNI
jgi:hypothetical protein